ncbi:sigma-70 family RNA polymerase sigma factor [Phenylobacterium sp.]|uniref:RNA polymerase sigma factor n=1 Tax=Phenylobacterium sp. TaxID=1871053 RepID=UPI0025E36572|nr:sigma-70 family RNA polymerase sigma factor [Phenylobacterium sp.]
MPGASPADLEQMPDRLLSSRAAAGDAGAFAILVRRSLPTLRGFLRRLGAPPDLADDLAQDALVAAFERIGDYRGDGAFVAWVRRIAARRYLRAVQARMRLAPLEAAQEPSSPAPDTGRSLDLDAALERLSPVQRLCVTLQHGAGYTSAEISQATGLPEGSVKSHISRGLSRLRQDLGSDR